MTQALSDPTSGPSTSTPGAGTTTPGTTTAGTTTAAPAPSTAPVDAEALVAGVQQLLASSQTLRQSITDEHAAEAKQADASAALDAANGATKAAQAVVVQSVADVQAKELTVLSIIQPPPPATATAQA